MMKTYTYPEFAYRQSEEQRTGQRARHPVVVIGAGPIGLTAALECARLGIPVVVLDDNNTVSVGSRAVCYAKRPLEIWDRLGAGDEMVERGVSWKLGRVFFRQDLAYTFDLLPEAGHKMPAMINLQQYYLEEMLVERCDRSDLVDLRWKHRLLSLRQTPDHAVLTVETPDGIFQMEAGWVIACDGANSDTRRMVGSAFTGQFFQDRFLIADVVMKADFPTERWFWFDPDFHRNQSVLLHRQCDNIWRIDFQLGWDADPVLEKTPERVIPRVRALLGPDAKFELEWVSVYTFSCVRMDHFRHGRVLFAGDAAHGVSPFGARGANSGVQDAENLAWKLAYVLAGRAPDSLLDSYASEREFAADENIRHSTRSTDFITPKSAVSRTFRDAVLTLARDHGFARQLVNSGRLSVPAVLHASPLNTADGDGEAFAGAMVPGAACADAPVCSMSGEPWLLSRLGDQFVALIFGAPAGLDAATRRALQALQQGAAPLRLVFVTDAAIAASADPWPGATVVRDVEGLAARRYDARAGTCYLIRPDQHVCARWRTVDAARVGAALDRAIGQAGQGRPAVAPAPKPMAMA